MKRHDREWRVAAAVAVLAFFASAGACLAQHEHMGHEMPAGGMGAMAGMDMQMSGLYGVYPGSRDASGTSWQPDSTPVEGVHLMRDDWMFMVHGFATLTYDVQRGRRGDEKLFSASMFMLMAQRPLWDGTFGLRGMLSLDPLMGRSGYPLLLQSGETGDGRTPLIDRQHPHDFFMEMAGTYSRPLSDGAAAFVYLGLPGEPALGPPAFMHRFSGMDAPSAPITHHWLDSTHITHGVATVGLTGKKARVEVSAFRGKESDQHRWDIESPRLDSVSARISFNPSENWAMQVSHGRIDSPEQLEPDVDTRRTTASISYNRPLKAGNWQSTFAWGRNDNRPGRALDGVLLESAVRVRDTHTVFGRIERVAKDELFPEGDPQHGDEFTVGKIMLGYLYEFPSVNHMKWGIGASFDLNLVPEGLKSAYGDNPPGYMVYLRLRLD